MAHGDISPLHAAREPFFVKMWPAYETEFETPALKRLKNGIFSSKVVAALCNQWLILSAAFKLHFQRTIS